MPSLQASSSLSSTRNKPLPTHTVGNVTSSGPMSFSPAVGQSVVVGLSNGATAGGGGGPKIHGSHSFPGGTVTNERVLVSRQGGALAVVTSNGNGVNLPLSSSSSSAMAAVAASANTLPSSTTSAAYVDALKLFGDDTMTQACAFLLDDSVLDTTEESTSPSTTTNHTLPIPSVPVSSHDSISTPTLGVATTPSRPRRKLHALWGKCLRAAIVIQKHAAAVDQETRLQQQPQKQHPSGTSMPLMPIPAARSGIISNTSTAAVVAAPMRHSHHHHHHHLHPVAHPKGGSGGGTVGKGASSHSITGGVKSAPPSMPLVNGHATAGVAGLNGKAAHFTATNPLHRHAARNLPPGSVVKKSGDPTSVGLPSAGRKRSAVGDATTMETTTSPVSLTGGGGLRGSFRPTAVAVAASNQRPWSLSMSLVPSSSGGDVGPGGSSSMTGSLVESSTSPTAVSFPPPPPPSALQFLAQLNRDSSSIEIDTTTPMPSQLRSSKRRAVEETVEIAVASVATNASDRLSDSVLTTIDRNHDDDDIEQDDDDNDPHDEVCDEAPMPWKSHSDDHVHSDPTQQPLDIAVPTRKLPARASRRT